MESLRSSGHIASIDTGTEVDERGPGLLRLSPGPRGVTYGLVGGCMSNVVFDSARWESIPHGTSAMLYRDGQYAAPVNAPEVLRLQRARWITVVNNYRHCGAIDLFEQPWWSPELLRSFVRGRRDMGCLARVYTDEAAAAEQVRALRDDGTGKLLAYEGLRWWVSTLDGRQLTAEQLAAELATRWDAPEITADRIWAHQRADLGSYDESDLFLAW